MRKLWGGAFGTDSDALVDAFGQTIDSDLTFWQEDLAGSMAHARMLGATGILSRGESEAILEGLMAIHEEGPGPLKMDVEDVHTAVETRLGEKIGPLAGKLHTARSRNDQVATDARLYLQNELLVLERLIKSFQGLLLDMAEKHTESVMPGYTHQQRAQPITLAMWLTAHFWAFQRHGWRAERVSESANYSPLGAGAHSGTTFPIDRDMTASELGFTGPIPNALDATSDRSYLMDALHVLALVMIELSRVSQDLILFSTHEFGFVRLDDSMTTGSSIMPQKRNADMAELIRGRTARALANWQTLAVVMKGLPLGYNRDTQEDKPPLFDSLGLAFDSLRLVHRMIETAEWRVARMADSVHGDFSTATDLANYLAETGMPFREAHEVVGKVVRSCQARDMVLEDLTEETLREIAPEVPSEALNVLSAEGSVRRRESLGGPGPKAMAAQIAHARRLLAAPGFERVA